MAWSIEAATQTGLFEKVLVSTDSEHYADIARQWGADVMMRGEAQSSDTATTYDVMEDLLGRLTENYDNFCSCNQPRHFVLQNMCAKLLNFLMLALMNLTS